MSTIAKQSFRFKIAELLQIFILTYLFLLKLLFPARGDSITPVSGYTENFMKSWMLKGYSEPVAEVERGWVKYKLAKNMLGYRWFKKTICWVNNCYHIQKFW